MFGFLKKNVNAVMKNFLEISSIVNYFAIFEMLCAIDKVDDGDAENETVALNRLRAAAISNYLFCKPFQQMHKEKLDEDAVIADAERWLRTDDLFCGLIVQSLRVMNTLEFRNKNNSEETIIGEKILNEYGHIYKDAPNPQSFENLIFNLASMTLQDDHLNQVRSYANKIGIQTN
ncbi:hypothetical protein [Methylotenera sp.]|uniref:hypothetical protein n=1 Tax=Methylotenera sp. TaxID=2051956 RepID=UPI00272FC6EB|nr:hypothetical protein [Methylotenera sp.]MDP2229942.1 hypothetical protein [Methylotenera sp.]